MAMQKLQRTQQPAAKASTPAKQKSFGSTGGEYRGTGNTATQSRSSGENEFANALATVTSSNAATEGPASIRTPELDSAVGNTNATGPLAASADPSNWTGDASLYLQMGGDVDRATVRGLDYMARGTLADTAVGLGDAINEAGYLAQGSMGGMQNDPTLSGDAAMYMQAFGDEIPKVEELKDITDFGRAFQKETEQTYGDMTGGWKTARDVAGSIGRQTPAMALNLIPGAGQALASAYLFGSAAGGATREASANGANPYEAMQYGIASGAVEAATEKLFDGMAGLLGKGAADDVVEKVIGKLTERSGSNAMRNALRLGFGALGEGAEEGISALADPILRSIYNNQTVRENYRDIDWGDVLYQIELGALSGGVLGSLGMANGQFRGKNAALNQRVVTEVVNDVLTNTPEGQATAARAQEAVSAENPLTQTILANEQGQQEQGSEFNTPQAPQSAEQVQSNIPAPIAQTVLNNEQQTQTNEISADEREAIVDRIESLTRFADQLRIRGNTQQEAEVRAQIAELNRQLNGGQAEQASAPAQATTTEQAPVNATPQQAASAQQAERPGTTVSRVAPAPSGAEGTNLSASVETVRNAKVTTDEMRALIDQSVADGGSRYFPITNDETLQKATDIIQQKGWDKALADWTADARTGRTSAEMQVVGQLLFNNAVNSGDLDLAMDIYTDYRVSGTNTAQALQARRILSNMAPQARLYKMERTVQSMLDELGNAVPEGVKISDELKQEFLNAPDEQTRDEVIGKIQKDLARQMPVTFRGADGRISWKNVLRKWTALRYLNMLGNLKTQGRNIFGNAVNAALYTLKNEVQAGIEGLAYAASGGKYERRTSAIVTDRNLIRAGMDYYKAHADAIDGESRLSDNLSANAFRRGIEKNQRVFTTPVIGQALEAGRRGTNLATEKGDTLFIGPRFARTLAGYLQANGIDAATFTGIQDGSIQPTAEQRGLIDRAVNYATQEAQEATFHDHNVISDTVANIGRGEKTWKPLKIIAEGIMPFRRTPANIAVRMEEFSPLGFVNAAVKAIQASKGNSNVTGADVINSLAKATTGTGLFLLGALLRNAGWLRGKDDDDKQEAFDRMQGEQDYSLVLPDGTSLTMDWVAPSSGVLFTGAQFADALADGKLTGNDLQKVLSSITDPMVEMSMLQGINDALENIRYADSNIFEFAMSSAISYLTQGLTSTLAGQAERTVEDHRTETYVDTESWLPRSVQRQLGKFGEKSPFFDYNQVEYLDAWGRPQMYEDNAFGRALENFTSPAYISGDNSTAVDDELQRLYDAGMGNVFPQRISMTDKISTYDAHGQKTGERQLTADEYVQVQRQAGQGSLRMVQDLMGSAMYDAMSDEARAEAISAIYQYNKHQALRGVEPSMKDEYAEVAGLSNIPAYFAVQKAYNDATDNRWARDYAEAQDVMESYSTLPQDVRAYIEEKDSQVRKVHEAYEQGVQPRTWFQVYDKVHDLTPYGDNASVSAWQKYETVVQTNPQQADALLQSYMDESTYARYQVAREFGVSPELFTDYYREKSLNNGRKDDCINWMLSQGYSKKQAEYMYYLFKAKAADLPEYNAGYR